ncbi:hypothetical protein SUDANB6_00098 [Streptomyces sp. enrichment culture]
MQQLTKRLLESASEGGITDHLGYDKHDPAGRNGGDSRNGTRSTTVLTDAGPVEIVVPRDRDGSLEPEIVKKRQKLLTVDDEMVISLDAKGLTPAMCRPTRPGSVAPKSPARRSPPPPTRSSRAWPSGGADPPTPSTR